MDGTEIVLTRQAASNTASDNELIGLWLMDFPSILNILANSLSTEDYELLKAFESMMTATMEFTADGKWIITINLLGNESKEEGFYSLMDGLISMNDSDFSPYTRKGDVLTITEGDISLTMTRIVAE